jgi:hypothetical protein
MDKTQIEQFEYSFIEKQKGVCQKYGALFTPSPFNKLIGVAIKSFGEFNMPINGLRHPDQSEQTINWYIWAGEYAEAPDFFKPVHIYHLLEICPKAINFLGLAPGWRFLFDNVYEDVWYDENLLTI